MAQLKKEQRRMNRKHVLDALKEETGTSGGTAAASRVDAFCEDPIGASTVEFSYVGGLSLSMFYIDPTKPNNSERASLWINIMNRMEKQNAIDPGGWDANTQVMILQAIGEKVQ